MAHTVCITDYGCIPDSAVIVGIIGSLYDQFGLAVNRKGIYGVFNQGDIIRMRGAAVGRYYSGFTEAVSVYIDFGGTEGLRQVELDITVSGKVQTPGRDAVRVPVFME